MKLNKYILYLLLLLNISQINYAKNKIFGNTFFANITILNAISAYLINTSNVNTTDLTVKNNANISGDIFAKNLTITNKITAESITVDTITGNLIGNVTGNLTGDVTGNLTGNVTGNLLGTVTGIVYGNLIGTVTGNVYGAASLNVLKSGDTMTGPLTVNSAVNLGGQVNFTGSYSMLASSTSINLNDTAGLTYNFIDISATTGDISLGLNGPSPIGRIAILSNMSGTNRNLTAGSGTLYPASIAINAQRTVALLCANTNIWMQFSRGA